MLTHTFYSEPSPGRLSRGTVLLPTLLLVCCAAANTLADESKLPDAEKILDRYVEATGGQAAYDRIDTRVSRGSIEFVGQGIEMDLTIYAAKPNKVYTVAESEQVGRIENGVDGDLAWSNSTMQGPQIKEGAERIDALRDATFDWLAHWRKSLEKAETIGLASVEGRPAYRILASPVQGGPQTLSFDEESQLLVKIESTVYNQMGAIPLEAYPSDYREVDGVRLAHRIRVIVMGQERVMTTNSIEHNVQLETDRFEPPAEIRALLAGKRGGTADRCPGVQ
jgi:hypothetical protein